MVIYLYSGKMDGDDLALWSLLDLMELLNMINLPSESSVVEAYTLKNITNGKYAMPDCLKSLDDCSKIGLKSVGKTLLTHLGRNFINICEVTEMGELSYEMLTRLLQEKKGVETKATLRIKTLLFWLKVNSQKLSEESKDKTLKTMYFVLEHFTHRELASSDVRMSDLYDIDEIMERMDQLFKTLREEMIEKEDTLEERETEIKQ